MKTQLPILATIAALAMIAALALVVCNSGPPTAKNLGYNLEELGLEKGKEVFLSGVGGSKNSTSGYFLEMDQKGITLKEGYNNNLRSYYPWSSVKGITYYEN